MESGLEFKEKHCPSITGGMELTNGFKIEKNSQKCQFWLIQWLFLAHYSPPVALYGVPSWSKLTNNIILSSPPNLVSVSEMERNLDNFYWWFWGSKMHFFAKVHKWDPLVTLKPLKHVPYGPQFVGLALHLTSSQKKDLHFNFFPFIWFFFLEIGNARLLLAVFSIFQVWNFKQTSVCVLVPSSDLCLR